MGSSSWRVSFAVSLLLTKDDSGKVRFSPTKADRSPSKRLRSWKARRRRRILACGASSGSDVRAGLGALLLDAASEVSERAVGPVSTGQTHKNNKLTICRSRYLLELDCVRPVPDAGQGRCWTGLTNEMLVHCSVNCHVER